MSICLGVGLVSCSETSHPSVEITTVKDGDTVEIQGATGRATVRLACIDAPELEQVPWGRQAALRLAELLPIGKRANLRVVGSDRYGRTVGELYQGDRSINLKMVQESQAVYRQHLENCFDTSKQYYRAEAKASLKERGFWNQDRPVTPWNYRSSWFLATPRSAFCNFLDALSLMV